MCRAVDRVRPRLGASLGVDRPLSSRKLNRPAKPSRWIGSLAPPVLGRVGGQIGTSVGVGRLLSSRKLSRPAKSFVGLGDLGPPVWWGILFPFFNKITTLILRNPH